MADNKKALLIIDMVNDFVRENGSLPVPDALEIIPNIKKLIDQFRHELNPIIYINDTHDPKDTEFEKWPPHSVKGTEGAKVVNELTPEPNDYIIEKRRYSGFFGTSLELLLNELGINEIYLTGTVTNICIFATALDGYMRGFRIYIPKNCVAGLDKNEHEFSIKQMENLMGAKIL